MKKKLIILVVILSFVFSFQMPVFANAASNSEDTETESACYALDVVFIIDQSESMSDTYSPTDPTNQRETAIEAMIDWLAENAFYICPGVRHQVGVISFGDADKSQVDLELTEISPSTFQEMRMLEQKLAKSVTATNLGATLPINAFKKAKLMLDGSTLQKDTQRKKVIIYLTDGQINDNKGNEGVGSYGKTKELADWVNANFQFNAKLLEREQCLNVLVDSYGSFDAIPFEEKNECMQQYDVGDSAYVKSTYIYTVLMNYGQSWSPDIKDIYQEMSESHGGQVMDFFDKGDENRNEIPSYFQEVLSRLAGIPSGRVDCTPIAVNPYLKKATFVFYKFSPDTKVKLTYKDANGVEYSISNGVAENGGFTLEKDGYQAYGTNESYIFTDPYPGIWYIQSDRCSNGGVSAFYQEVKINPNGYQLSFSELPQYDLPPYYDESAPTYITYQMHDDAGNVVNQSDQSIFAINIVATVTDPTGKVTSYPLVWNAEKSIYVAKDPLQIPVAGTYKVDFSGTTMEHVGSFSNASESLSETFNQSVELISQTGLEFTVSEVTPFVATLINPTEGQKINYIHGTILEGWPLKVKPIEIKVKIAWRDRPLDTKIDSLLTEPNESFVAWVEFPDGKTSEKVTLQVDPKSADTFVGEIPGIDATSPMIMHVELQGEVAEGYRPDHRVLTANFTRHDTFPWTNPGFYRLMIMFIILGLLGLTIFEIIDHYDPVDGMLEIKQNNVVIGQLSLWKHRKIARFSKKVLDGYDLIKLNVKYKKYEKPEQDGYTNADPVRDIVVSGVTACNKMKFEPFSLMVNDSYSYCPNDTEFEMKYLSLSGMSKKPKLQMGLYFIWPVVAIVLSIIFFMMK